jgi:uncharacterized protein (UPF0276 family)
VRGLQLTLLPVGIGLGWRPETALLVERREDLTFSEVVAELVDPKRPPPALAAAIERGLPVVTHGVGLDLGGAHGADRARVKRLVQVARTLRSPLVSEHVAFCRTPTHESPHFLPVPRTRPQLALLVDHVRRVQDALPVPFALENVAAPIAWPGDELADADFLAELVARTGALLLLDASNVHANLVNHGGDLERYLARLPLERVVYMHAAGGARIEATGMYRDTHAHRIDAPVVHTLAQILARTGPVPLLLERDGHYDRQLDAELDELAAVLAAAPDPIAPSPVTRTPIELPVVDGALRDHLAARHTLLLDTLANPSAPAQGFDAHHLAETRAILGNKGTRLARKHRSLLR